MRCLVGIISGEIHGWRVAGATYYRAILPASQLGMRGAAWVAGTRGCIGRHGLQIQDALTGVVGRPDVVVGVRWSDDRLQPSLEAAKIGGQRIVLDLDDALWAVPRSNAAHPLSDPARSPRNNYRLLIEACELADELVASTDELARQWRAKLREAGSAIDIRVVPNMIDISRWQRPYRHGCRLGWTGSVAHRDRELDDIVRVMRWARAHGWTPVHVGGGELPGAADIGPIPAEAWETSADHYDVGLAMVADTPFSRAKSDIKVLEYSAARKPWVAMGAPYEDWSDVGFVARNRQDIYDGLDQLRDAEVARMVAERCYSRALERDIRDRYKEFAAAWGVG